MVGDSNGRELGAEDEFEEIHGDKDLIANKKNCGIVSRALTCMR